jgi:hypothetical protein
VAVVAPGTRDDMYALFVRHYCATSPERFAADLAAKDYAVALHHLRGHQRGFSMLGVSQLDVGGRPLRVVFSGDTIIEPAYWGSQAFAYTWICLIGHIAAQALGAPLYWLFIVKGYHTYRYLTTFGLRVVPDWRNVDDDDAIATKLFGTPSAAPSRHQVRHSTVCGELV